MTRLREECEKAKQAFADPTKNEVEIKVERIKRSVKFVEILTRDMFKELISTLL